MRPTLLRRVVAPFLVGAMAVAFVAGGAGGAGATPGQVVAGFGPSGDGTVQRASEAAVLRQSDGKIVAVGTEVGVVVITRQTVDGALDPTFGHGGVVETARRGGIHAVTAALQPDGKIVVAGAVDDNTPNLNFWVARYRTNGSLDPAFGTGGVVTSDFGGDGDFALSVAIAPGGKIAVAGLVHETRAGVARYNANGTLDSTFGTAGLVMTPDTASFGGARVVAVQPDGKVLLGTVLASDQGPRVGFDLRRYNVNGSVDTTFGTGGRANPASSTLAAVDDIVLQGSKIVAAGFVDLQHIALARFNANGTIDTTFGSHGTVVVSAGRSTGVGQLLLDDAGRLLVIGSSSMTNDFPNRELVTLFRFSPNGARDMTFGCNGVVITELLGTGTARFQQSIGNRGAIAGNSLVVGAIGIETSSLNPPPTDGMLVKYDLSNAGAGHGYTLVRADGGTSAFGDAPACGSVSGAALVAPIVGAAHNPVAKGSWSVASDGGIFTFGSAKFFGSMGGKHLDQPIVGMAPTADGKGYWLVASDGGIFAFGSAKFFGSMGGKHLDQPIVGIAPAGDGKGYWLVASDGGIFAFGSAKFFGSMGGRQLVAGVAGMAAARDGRGYYLVASDGGVFAFGSAKFFGSMGGRHLNDRIVGIATDPDGAGYWMAGMDGGIFAFNAPFLGSTGATPFGVTAVRTSAGAARLRVTTAIAPSS